MAYSTMHTWFYDDVSKYEKGKLENKAEGSHQQR